MDECISRPANASKTVTDKACTAPVFFCHTFCVVQAHAQQAHAHPRSCGVQEPAPNAFAQNKKPLRSNHRHHYAYARKKTGYAT